VKTIQLLNLTPREARANLTTGAPVYLSVNPVEFHGPHLSLHNDSLVSAGLIREMHARLRARHPDWPLLLAGELEIGVETVPGPGSQPVSFPDACRGVLRAVEALAGMGAQRVVLMSFHGSPLHNLALFRGEQALRRQGVQALSPMNQLFEIFLALRDGSDQLEEVYAPIADPAQRAAARRETTRDIHAGFMETSLTLHYAPETVRRHQQVPPCPAYAPDRVIEGAARLAGRLGRRRLAGELGFAAAAVAWYGLRPFPGYTGQPHLANAASGAALADALSRSYADRAEEVFFEGGAPPPPVMPWVKQLTLGGRLGKGLYNVWPEVT
jgi:creatinine amidohydrolase